MSGPEKRRTYLMKVDVRTRVRGDKRREGQYINEFSVDGLILYVYRGTYFVS